MDFVAERLAAARQELLDLGLRNPLLNFRPRKSRGITVMDERPAQLFTHLVQQGQTMGFLPLAEEETYPIPADWLPQPDDPIRAADRHEDDYLQTPYSSPVLQERLLNTHLAARAAIDEQGVNILYLALGMLHWRELGGDSPSRHAPLILLPVQLDRKDAAHPFRLAYTGGEISENLSLRFKLQTDFGLSLPPFPEVETFAVTGYMAQVAAAAHWPEMGRFLSLVSRGQSPSPLSHSLTLSLSHLATTWPEPFFTAGVVKCGRNIRQGKKTNWVPWAWW